MLQAPPAGAPPPDTKALVEAPKGPADALEIKKPTDGTSVSLSAGGQWAAGNSNLLAGTVNGILDLRRGENGFGAALIGNYGQSAPPGKEETANTENLQGRVRYDRYLSERVSLFGTVSLIYAYSDVPEAPPAPTCPCPPPMPAPALATPPPPAASAPVAAPESTQ